MKINEVSEMFEISADTLRYYEKMGLIDPIQRKNGIRDYHDEDLKRIKFIKCMRLSGLSIEMLKQYIDLYREGEQTVSKRKEILIKQREDIVKKINNLQETLDHLDYKIEIYDDILSKQ